MSQNIRTVVLKYKLNRSRSGSLTALYLVPAFTCTGHVPGTDFTCIIYIRCYCVDAVWGVFYLTEESEPFTKPVQLNKTIQWGAPGLSVRPRRLLRGAASSRRLNPCVYFDIIVLVYLCLSLISSVKPMYSSKLYYWSACPRPVWHIKHVHVLIYVTLITRKYTWVHAGSWNEPDHKMSFKRWESRTTLRPVQANIRNVMK